MSGIEDKSSLGKERDGMSDKHAADVSNSGRTPHVYSARRARWRIGVRNVSAVTTETAVAAVGETQPRGYGQRQLWG